MVFRDSDEIEILSKSGKSLARYFPEIVAMIAAVPEEKFILDGELIVPVGAILSFDALQARLHPAQSRVDRLSRETPAQLMLFDCLKLGGHDLLELPLGSRREALELFHGRHGGPSLLLSACTRDPDLARAWLVRSGGALDGVVAKLLSEPYRAGKRVMLKVKQHRSADVRRWRLPPRKGWGSCVPIAGAAGQ